MLSKAISKLYICHLHCYTSQQGNFWCTYYYKNDILFNHKMCSYLMILNMSYSFVYTTYTDHLLLNNLCLYRYGHILNYWYHNLKSMYLRMISKWSLDLNKFDMDSNKEDILHCKHNIHLGKSIDKFC